MPQVALRWPQWLVAEYCTTTTTNENISFHFLRISRGGADCRHGSALHDLMVLFWCSFQRRLYAEVVEGAGAVSESESGAEQTSYIGDGEHPPLSNQNSNTDSSQVSY